MTSPASPLDSPTERPVILVGFSMAWVHELKRWLPEGSIIFIEDPDIVEQRGVREMTAPAPVVREVIPFEYPPPGAADCFYQLHRDLDPIAVIPVSDYATPFAARLGERYGVPTTGYGAAIQLRDKDLLRRTTTAAGIPNPESVEVGSPDEVRAFMTRIGKPIVLKPANRRASVGTKIIHDPADVDAAWLECTDLDEGAFNLGNPFPLRMLAERFMQGTEYSVEMLVRDGQVLFASPTRKFLFDGPRPVEQGHLHPADVDADLFKRLVDSTARVIEAVGMATGFVHGEWIVEDGVPHLVECGGRMAGDGIIELIIWSYKYEIVRAYLDVMRGLPLDTEPPATHQLFGAAWMTRTAQGRVAAIEGVDKAKLVPGTHTVAPLVKVGDVIHPLRSSWDRGAMATAEAETADEALALARQAVELIELTIDPLD